MRGSLRRAIHETRGEDVTWGAKNPSDDGSSLLREQLRKRIKPPLTDEIWDQAEVFCSIKYNLKSISFVQMDKQRNIHQWGFYPLFGKVSSRVTFEQHRVSRGGDTKLVSFVRYLLLL